MIISGTPFTPGLGVEKQPFLNWFGKPLANVTLASGMNKEKRCRSSSAVENGVPARSTACNTFEIFAAVTDWIAFRNEVRSR
jgi:hypothetical protein